MNDQTINQAYPGFSSFLPFPRGVEEIDFLVSAAALNDKTNKIINDSILTACKPGVRVVNVSRGPIIDENSLVSHLKSGHVHSAALDVFEEEPPSFGEELYKRDDVLLSPHIAGLTDKASKRMALACIENAINYLNGTINPNLIVNKEALI